MWSSDIENQPIVGMLHLSIKRSSIKSFMLHNKNSSFFVLTNSNETKHFIFSFSEKCREQKRAHTSIRAIITRSGREYVRTRACTLIRSEIRRIGCSERFFLFLVRTNNNNDAIRCACPVPSADH